MTAIVRRLDSSGDMTFGAGKRNFAVGAEGTAQRVRCRLLLVTGEWFLDTDAGVPWWQPEDSGVQPIMGGPKNLQYAESVLKATILATDGVASIVSFAMRFDSQTRKLSVDVKCTTVDGDVVNVVAVGP